MKVVNIRIAMTEHLEGHYMVDPAQEICRYPSATGEMCAVIKNCDGMFDVLAPRGKTFASGMSSLVCDSLYDAKERVSFEDCVVSEEAAQ